MNNDPYKNKLQLHLHSKNVYPQNVEFLNKRGIKPSPIYEVYWQFASERQNIFQKRKNGESHPWTNNQIFQKYKFTNAYRASDRVSQYLIRNVIYSDCNKNFSPEDIFFRIILFKLFNKIETWEALENEFKCIDYKSYSFERYDSVLTNLINNGTAIYSAAYIMPSGKSFGSDKKHRNNLMLLEMMMSEHIVCKISKAHNLQELYKILLNLPSLGKFLAFQYAVDINYSELCNFDEMDYVVAGPGAQSGISKLFTDKNGYSDEYIIRLMAENQEQEFERLNLNFEYLGDRRLQLIDCQNLFCETDKYTRVAYPQYIGTSNRTRIKQHFSPKLLDPIQYFYPPKWKINI